MSTPRYQQTATLLHDGTVLITGGGNLLPPYTTFSSAEIYNPQTGSFAATGHMNSARDGHTATLLPDGHVLITGGYVADGFVFLDGAELYDASTGLFSHSAGMVMSEKRRFHTATLLKDGRVLVAGGAQSRGPSNVLNDTDEVYNNETKTFSVIATSMVTRRHSHTATPLPNGKVLIAGGWNTYNSAVNTAELFNPVTNAFAISGHFMTAGRFSHTATLLANGKILIAGGSNGSLSSPYLNSAELYDPVTDTFTPTSGDMTVARGQHTATLLTGGKVLIAGGQGNQDILSSAEVYDPDTDMFTPVTGSMTVHRYQQTATLLSDGKALLAGGGTLSQPYTNSSELFDPLAYQGALVRNVSNPGAIYATLQAAYDSASGNDELRARNIVFNGSDLYLDRGIVISLNGGLQGDFATPGGYTTISGIVKISSGAVRLNRIIIR